MMPPSLTCELRFFTAQPASSNRVGVVARATRGRRLEHFLPKKSAAHHAARVADSAAQEVNAEQLELALRIIVAQLDSTTDAAAATELNIISSLDLDEVMEEADKLKWELSPPADLDVLRAYAPFLAPAAEEARQDDEGAQVV
jgi:hypothetical protein